MSYFFPGRHTIHPDNIRVLVNVLDEVRDYILDLNESSKCKFADDVGKLIASWRELYNVLEFYAEKANYEFNSTCEVTEGLIIDFVNLEIENKITCPVREDLGQRARWAMGRERHDQR